MNEPKIFSLEGKIAFVTGASGNIGKMAGRAYALHGARVVLVDIDLPGAEEVAEEICQAGAEAMELKMDVTNPAEVESVVRNVIDKYGRIDVLFNNVGIKKIDRAIERAFSLDFEGLWGCASRKLDPIDWIGFLAFS